jgi:hypothetical protein
MNAQSLTNTLESAVIESGTSQERFSSGNWKFETAFDQSASTFKVTLRYEVPGKGAQRTSTRQVWSYSSQSTIRDIALELQKEAQQNMYDGLNQPRTTGEIAGELETLLVATGVAYQIFYQDGWSFLVEPDPQGAGFHVKLEFNFTYDYTPAANGKWYASTRMEQTQTRSISGSEDNATLQRIAQDLHDEANRYCWQHMPPRPLDR